MVSGEYRAEKRIKGLGVVWKEGLTQTVLRFAASSVVTFGHFSKKTEGQVMRQWLARMVLHLHCLKMPGLIVLTTIVAIISIAFNDDDW